MNITAAKSIPFASQSTDFNKPPLRPKAMARLPLGVVRPDGWLKHQLDLMCDGTVGHLDELSPFLDDDNGWLRYKKDYTGTEDAQVKGGWEEAVYWIRGLYPLAVITENGKLLDKALRYIETILESGDEDGYFGAKQNKRTVGKDGKAIADLWPNMVVIDFLILYYEVTKDHRVIPLLTEFFQFCRKIPDEQFLAVADWSNYAEEMESHGNWKVDIQYRRAGDMIPHIYWLYSRTGEDWLLPLARRFFDKIAPYYPARKHDPFYLNPPEDYLDAHVVHFAQRYGYFGIYSQQDDQEFRLSQGEYWYDQHMATWGQHPRGIFSADEMIRSGKTDPRQGFETCTMIEFAKHFYELGRITGDTLYADRAEDIMLNHFPVTHDKELKGLHYLTCSNQIQLDKEQGHDLFNDHKGMMFPYSGLSSYPRGYRCCQHNAGSSWPWYVQNLWQTTADDGLCLWLYGASHLETAVGKSGRTVRVTEKTNYPFSGDVMLHVEADEPVQFPLYLRVPRWCTHAAISVDGKTFSTDQKGGYVKIEGEWQNNTVEIVLMMEITWTRWPRSGAATLDRGPLSYSVKIDERWVLLLTNPYWPSHEVYPASKWNYAICHPSSQEPVVEVSEQVADQPWTVEDAPIKITLKGKSLDSWGIVDKMVEPLPTSPVKGNGDVQDITFIPLGCARLRISCLPIIE